MLLLQVIGFKKHLLVEQEDTEHLDVLLQIKGIWGSGMLMAPEPILVTMIGGNMIQLQIRGLKKQIIQLEIMPLYLLQ